ncbi:NAD(P)/FAD-dependent oxidoreductase [Streptomyces sp. NPDC015032]|uniref:NAD(P)/FAD-dependent oxidoreductase n=1 Tax=Streptomyces sp. NPDC015032 TaxID=3364937 RepID=UPI0036FA91AB
MSRIDGRENDPILVIGAGIVGASIAHHLARSGRRVTVLERSSAAEGVTGKSFAWIGFAKSAAAAYSDQLRGRAAEEFDRLKRELTEPVGLRSCGAITWEETEAETREFIDSHHALGHPIRLLSREDVLAREPSLLKAPKVAAYAPGDVGVDPAAFTRALLRAAEENGATVHPGTDALSLLTDGTEVRGVSTAHGPVYGSTVVLATGTETPRLAASTGAVVEIDASPCCLIRYSTPYPLVNGILSGPDFEIRQLDDTTLIAAEDVPEGFENDPRELARPTLRAIRRLLAGGNEVELLDAAIADRPVPRDGRPLLGYAEGVSGLYLAAAHPAMILSGAIGAHVAQELA